MKLEGTLDAFGLPDVLQLLAIAKKTGVLHLARSGREAAVEVSEGALWSVIATSPEDAAVSDVLAELLTWDDGEFAFEADCPLAAQQPPAVADLLSEAQHRAESWRALAELAPEPRAVLGLAPSIQAGVTLDPRQWGVLAFVDGRRSVQEICALIGSGEFGSRAVLGELVQQGLLTSVGLVALPDIEDAPAPPTPRVAVPVARRVCDTSSTSSLEAPAVPAAAAVSWGTGGHVDIGAVVGSSALKPEHLVAPLTLPAYNADLLSTLVVSIRGL